MRRVVDEVTASMPSGSAINQGQVVVDEKTVDAVIITGEDGVPPPPPGPSKFPWWIVGLSAVAVVVARTRKILKKEKRS